MQTGVAEGLDTSAASAIDMHFDEVTSSLLKTNHMFGTMTINMSGKAFAAVDDATRELLVQAARDTGNYIDLEVAIPAENKAYETLEGLGVRIVEPADPAEWQAAMTPLLDEIAAKASGADHFIDMLRSAD